MSIKKQLKKATKAVRVAIKAMEADSVTIKQQCMAMRKVEEELEEVHLLCEIDDRYDYSIIDIECLICVLIDRVSGVESQWQHGEINANAVIDVLESVENIINTNA